MTVLRRATRLTTLVVSAALIVAACGGSTAATPAAGEPTPAPAAATPEPAAATEAPVTGEIPAFDLSAMSGAIPGVDSYRTSFSVDGVEQYHTVVVTQPVLSKAITVTDAGAVSSRLIIIGKETWTADGTDGAFEPVPEALASAMILAYDPMMMLGGYAGVDWGPAATDQGVEDKNGVRARHLKIDPTTLVGLAAAMPAGSSIDIWIADAGYPVAWEMTGFESGGGFSIQITGVDDPANKVERPS